MHFSLIDSVLELQTEPPRIVAVKQVSSAEEYLQDHFPAFPVLPGVLMIETLVQAARRLAHQRGVTHRLVLGTAKAVKYGRFVRPGEALVVEVSLLKEESGVLEFKGEGRVRGANGAMIEGATAVSGRFTLRPVNAG